MGAGQGVDEPKAPWLKDEGTSYRLGYFNEQRGFRRRGGTGADPSLLSPSLLKVSATQCELSRATRTPEVGQESKGLLEPVCEVEQASAPSALPSQPYPFV